MHLCCRLPHGRRGLKFSFVDRLSLNHCRLPHGRRGLKSKYENLYRKAFASPPSREAWIEIHLWSKMPVFPTSPPSREAWIEILQVGDSQEHCKSPPSREAWIEILTVAPDRFGSKGRLPHGRRGLKFSALMEAADMLISSPPSREAWIEITSSVGISTQPEVASLTGGVD